SSVLARRLFGWRVCVDHKARIDTELSCQTDTVVVLAPGRDLAVDNLEHRGDWQRDALLAHLEDGGPLLEDEPVIGDHAQHFVTRQVASRQCALTCKLFPSR